MQLPTHHEAGISFDQVIKMDDFPSHAFELRVFFRGPSSFQIVGLAQGDGSYRLEADAETTADWVAGDYEWRARAVSNAGTRYAGRGRITIDPDFATGDFDPRTHAEKALEAICAVLEKSATFDQQSYTIGGRSLTRHSLPELHQLKKEYAHEVARERAVRNGQSLRNGPLGKRIDAMLK